MEDKPERADLDRVRSRAESLAHEESDVDIDDHAAQAAAMLDESDARSEDPDTMEHTSGYNERRRSDDAVDPT